MSNVILLMGAPTSQSLHWNEDGLLNTAIPPFHNPGSHHQEFWPFEVNRPVRWHLLQDQHAEPELDPNCATGFFTTEGLTATAGEEDSVLSQFYDHSFTVHETSEVSLPLSYSGNSSSQESSATSSAISSSKRDGSGPASLHIQGQISDLQDIPSAGYLRSIVPQTVTVNLVVGIITVQPPRRIVTRQWKRELDIVEMVVGDETRTGFGITFWLSTEPRNESGGVGNNNQSDELGQSLASLRPRDIVLLRMIGLSSFQERVYGQSLRKGVTQVDLLHRRRVDATDAVGLYGLRRLNAGQDEQDPVVIKVRQVREWIQRFVGAAPEPAGGDMAAGMCPMKRGRTLLLPPDTQEDV